jgi:hypothetical protein
VNSNSHSYGSYRQHNFISSSSSISSFLSLVDQKSFNKFFSFVLNTKKTQENFFSKIKPYDTIYNQNLFDKKRLLENNNYMISLENQLGSKLSDAFFYK